MAGGANAAIAAHIQTFSLTATRNGTAFDSVGIGLFAAAAVQRFLVCAVFTGLAAVRNGGGGFTLGDGFLQRQRVIG